MDETIEKLLKDKMFKTPKIVLNSDFKPSSESGAVANDFRKIVFATAQTFLNANKDLAREEREKMLNSTPDEHHSIMKLLFSIYEAGMAQGAAAYANSLILSIENGTLEWEEENGAFPPQA